MSLAQRRRLSTVSASSGVPFLFSLLSFWLSSTNLERRDGDGDEDGAPSFGLPFYFRRSFRSLFSSAPFMSRCVCVCVCVCV